MCGRLNILANMLNYKVSDELRIRYHTVDNPDLSPRQNVSAIINSTCGLQQFDMTWGIKPDWAKKLLINAQVETASDKPTWKSAMQHRRCIVPCSGWYEWRDEGGPKKQKYLFSHESGKPLYMAGLWFDTTDGERPELVTLTTAADTVCQPYHHRMPLLIDVNEIENWLRNQQSIELLLAQLRQVQNQGRTHTLSINPTNTPA